MSAAKTLKAIVAALRHAWEHDESEGQTLVEIEVILEKHYGRGLRDEPEDES
jgi:allophanate hydrolase subunit 1